MFQSQRLFCFTGQVSNIAKNVIDNKAKHTSSGSKQSKKARHKSNNIVGNSVEENKAQSSFLYK